MFNIVKDYFQSWIDKDISVINSHFSQDILYSECYGPVYKGLDQIRRWFEEWNRKGSVLQWNIKEHFSSNRTIIVEWYFQCEYEGNVDGFDGVSIILFDEEEKILSVKEFQSKAEHHYPYGDH